ncbi:MAG: aldo/keto reductase [Solirubrobacteraceae bacterium]|nr:aldo/keto reductase [Solirubrobacteraceae bacterium]
MIYKPLGGSGLQVSVISLGTMGFGGVGGFARAGTGGVDDARAQIDLCLDAGVNLVDTADAYSSGVCEEIVGEAIRGKRDQLLIATKCGMNIGPTLNDRGLSRHHIIRQCEGSLRRLGVDHIDLYQAHSWDGLTPLEETVAAFDELVQSGKVRYLGLSNFSGWQVMKAQWTASDLEASPFVSQQIHYTLQAREAEYELLPTSVDQGLGILSWSPLAGGLLTGKYRRGRKPPEGARHLTDWNEPPVRDEDQLFAIVDELVAIGEELEVPPVQVGLAWLRERPMMSSLIVGARTPEQLADSLGSVHVSLSDDQAARLDAVSSPALIYPYWHQRQTVAERFGPADAPLHGPRGVAWRKTAVPVTAG